MPPKNTLLGMTTAEPVSTGVHSNINNLLAQSDKTHLWQKALGEIEKGMSNYKHPDPITGTVPDVALSPLLAAKSIPSMMKLLKNIKLRNPVYHHTAITNAARILKSKKISGMHQPDKFLKDVTEPIRAFSVTRDPMFLSRPHSNIGTDVRFIMDRDELIRKGYRLKPYAEEGFRKTKKIEGNWKFPNVKKIFYKGEQKSVDWLEKRTTELTRQGKNWEKELKNNGLKFEYHSNKINPRFEFEERVLGDLPTKDIKLIDWTKIPIEHGTTRAQGLARSKYGEIAPTHGLGNILKYIMNRDKGSSQLPLIMSEQVRNTLKKVQPYLTSALTQSGRSDKLKSLEKIMAAPTYKYNPFRTPKIKVWDEKLQKAVMIDSPK